MMHPKVAYVRARFYRWLRRVLVGLFLTVLLTAGVAVYRITRPTLPVVDYRAQEIEEIRASVDPAWAAVGGDALGDWNRAENILQAAEQEYRGGDPDDHWSGRRIPNFEELLPNAERKLDLDIPLEGDLLEALDLYERRGLLEALDAVASCGMLVSSYEPDKLIISGRIWHVGVGRGCIRFSMFRVESMLGIGMMDEACRSLGHVRAIIRHTEANAGIVNYLVANSERAILAHGVRRILEDEERPEASTVRMLLGELLVVGGTPGLERYLEHERNMTLEIWQELFTGEPEVPDSDGIAGFQPWQAKLLSTHKDAAARIDAFFDALIKWSGRELTERERRVWDLYSSLDGKPEWIGKSLQSLISSYVRVANNREKITCEWNGTIIMAAIEVYRARYGEAPASLGDLVPEILHRLPVDPFAVDGVYRYESLGDSGEYLLYSIGYDQTDEGGNPALERDGHALIGECPGSDFIFHDGRGEARLSDSLH